MSICWYCHWGWSKKVEAIHKKAIDSAEDAWSALHFGPSHIVWEDENFDDWSIQFCKKALAESDGKFTAEQIEAVRWSLEELEKIPENERCTEPEDYDDQNPEDFPPPAEYYT